MDTEDPSRVRPKASERCCRRCESSSTIIPETDDDSQIVEGEGDEKSEALTMPFPGGSTDITLLRSFKTHTMAHI